MVQVPVLNQRWTFDEFIAEFDPGDDSLHLWELEDGKPIKMPEPSWAHEFIADFLCKRFEAECEQMGPSYLVRRFVAVKVGQGKGRKPDVTVFSRTLVKNLRSQAQLPVAPKLAVEIASPGNWRTDYTEKRLYYAAIGIQEYWIADFIPCATEFLEVPNVPAVLVHWLAGGNYQVKQYRGRDRIISPTFPNLNLTVDQLVAAAEV